VDVDRPQPGGRLLGSCMSRGGRIGRIHLGAQSCGPDSDSIPRGPRRESCIRAGGHRGPADFPSLRREVDFETIGPPSPRLSSIRAVRERDHVKISLELKGVCPRGWIRRMPTFSSPRRAGGRPMSCQASCGCGRDHERILIGRWDNRRSIARFSKTRGPTPGASSSSEKTGVFEMGQRNSRRQRAPLGPRAARRPRSIGAVRVAIWAPNSPVWIVAALARPWRREGWWCRSMIWWTAVAVRSGADLRVNVRLIFTTGRIISKPPAISCAPTPPGSSWLTNPRTPPQSATGWRVGAG